METEWLVLMRDVKKSGDKTPWVVIMCGTFSTETKAKDYIVQICGEFPDTQFTAVPVPK